MRGTERVGKRNTEGEKKPSREPPFEAGAVKALEEEEREEGVLSGNKEK